MSAALVLVVIGASTRNNAALPAMFLAVILLAVTAVGAPHLARRINSRRRARRSLPHS